jgi:hypothetical protein
MDHLACRTARAVSADMLVSHTEVHGRVGLIDGGHHVGAHIDECPREVFSQGSRVSGYAGLLVLGSGMTRPPPGWSEPAVCLGVLLSLKCRRHISTCRRDADNVG